MFSAVWTRRAEQTFSSQNALYVAADNIGKDVGEVKQAAQRAKSSADADYKKTADAAGVALARFCAAAAAAANPDP